MIDPKSENLQLRVKLSISRTSGGGDGFRISLDDPGSNIEIFRGDFPAESYANLVSNRLVDVYGTLSLSPLIGKAHQTDSILVPLPPDYGDVTALNAAVAAFIAEFRVGWEARPEANFNSHRVKRSADGLFYQITISRWM